MAANPERPFPLPGFIAASLLLHAALFALSSNWLWSPPMFDAPMEPPPVVINLEEWVEPEPPPPEPPPPERPPPEPEPLPEPEPPPEPEPEPEPEPIPEIAPEPLPPEPAPVEPEPEPEPPPEPPPATTVMAIELPGYLRNPAPPYPAEARRNGWEGRVLLRVDVTANGRAQSVTVVTSSGYPALDNAARTTVARWRFTPGRLGGQPTAATVEVPVSFTLRRDRDR